MAGFFKLNLETFDENGIPTGREVVYSGELKKITHIKDVGLNHKEQLELLQNTLDGLLPYQFNDIDHAIKCEICGNKTKKNGVFDSHFHTVFTDHKVSMQRMTCGKCGWINKYTVDGLLGSSSHPDLLKLQCELGADYSFTRSENILKAQNTIHRPINNQAHIADVIEKFGPIIGQFKTEEPVNIEKQASILVAQIDGGHIQPKEKDIRSYEVLVAKCYNLENKVEKDQHHTELLKSTCVASALSDHGETIRKQLIYAALSEGMTKETVVYALVLTLS